MSVPLAAIFGDAEVQRPPRAKLRRREWRLGPAPRSTASHALRRGAEPAQTRVLRQAEHRPLTLVIGPPGTGKSFTIAQIILDAVARGQTVLLSSKMNKAVDVVVEKLKPHLGSLTVILRGGDKRYRDELKQFLDNLFDGTGAPQKPRPGEIEMLEERLRAADEELARIDAENRSAAGAEEQWLELARALSEAAEAPHYDEAPAARLGPEEIERLQDELRDSRQTRR